MKEVIKNIYRLIPFKKNIFQGLKLFWKPKETTYRHLYFTGIFDVKVGPGKRFKMKHYGYQLENEIFWAGLTGSWEKESLKLWISLCKHSQVIFDIGANTGVFALVAKTVNPQSKVYAFEPVKRILDKLKENNSLNKYDIIPVELAVSNTDGTETIYDIPDEHAYSVTFNKAMVPPGSHVIETPMETVRLDTYIRDQDIKQVDLIKIDVEAHEPQVLEGFKEHLFRFKPAILIEVLYAELGEEINKLVDGMGYLFFNVNESGDVRQVKRIGRSDDYNYLICQPDTAKRIGLVE